MQIVWHKKEIIKKSHISLLDMVQYILSNTTQFRILVVCLMKTYQENQWLAGGH